MLKLSREFSISTFSIIEGSSIILMFSEFFKPSNIILLNEAFSGIKQTIVIADFSSLRSSAIKLPQPLCNTSFLNYYNLLLNGKMN